MILVSLVLLFPLPLCVKEMIMPKTRDHLDTEPPRQPPGEFVPIPIPYLDARQPKTVGALPDRVVEGRAGTVEPSLADQSDRLGYVIAVRIREAGHRVTRDLLQTGFALLYLVPLRSDGGGGEERMRHCMGADFDQPLPLQVGNLL